MRQCDTTHDLCDTTIVRLENSGARYRARRDWLWGENARLRAHRNRVRRERDEARAALAALLNIPAVTAALAEATR